MSGFDVYAGQEVASGIRKAEPAIAFEHAADRAYLSNMELINGLMPKIGKVLIHETRVMNNPLDRIWRRSSMPYGVGIEHAQFAEGAINAKTDGTCVPIGNPPAVSQLALINLAWSIDVSVYDREIDKAVLSPDEAARYVAQKMRTAQKTLAMLRYRAQTQLLSDVIDGTRSVSSTTSSDAEGTAVTYNPTIKGYAGSVQDLGIVLPPLAAATVPTFAASGDAAKMVKRIKNAATEMREDGTTYSALGVETLALDRPYLIIEEKVLSALDDALSLDGQDKRIPTRSAREYLAEYCDVVSFPGSFAELPTNSSYTKKRLAAVLIDKDSPTEAISWEDMEGQRCAKQRLTGYNLGGASVLSIYRGGPAAAFLASTEAGN